MIVGNHRPEPAKSLRGHRYAELGKVAFEESLHEAPPPECGPSIVRREERTGEAAPEPECAPRFRTGLRQIEAGEVDQSHTTREGFRYPAHERRRCAAEHEKTRRIVGPIREHAKCLEERRLTLDLVDDHEPGKGGQGLLRRLQPSPVHRAFEVEEGVPRRGSRKGACKGGLAALTRPGQGDHGVDGKLLVNARSGAGTIDDHASCYSLKIPNSIEDFQGFSA